MKDKKDKIYYFQEKSNDILDLQDELKTEEIGIYFILKAGYFKYSGELTKENIYQRCKFFGDKIKMDSMISKLFDLQDGLLVNSNWLSEINSIKQLSEKRKQIAEKRWNDEGLKQKGSKSEAKRKQKEPKKPSGLFGNPKEPKETLNDNVNKDDNVNEYDNVNNNFNIIENHNIKNKFDEFWSFYTPVAGRDGSFTPKGSKAEALQVYEKAIKKFTHEKIMANLEFYLKHCQKNARFTKHACSWLREALKDNFEFEVSLAIEPEKTQQKLTKDQLQDKINEEFLKKYSN